MKKTSRTALSCVLFRAATLIISMLVTSVSLSAQFCASKSNAPWELWIAKVQLNTLNNASEKYKDYNSLGYSDFTNINTTITKGMTYELTTTAGVSWSGIVPNAYCRTWIDWNRNNVFEDAELVAQNNAVNPFVSAIRVPTTAVSGATRMRIAVKSGSFPTQCEVYGSGEVEDYTVNIAEVVQSETPDLAIENSSFPTTWSVNRAINYSFDVRNIGLSPMFSNTIARVYLSADNQLSSGDLFVNSFTISGLAPNARQSQFDTLRLSPIWTSPTAFFIVKVDTTASETNLTNNTVSRPVSINLPTQSCANSIGNGKVLCFDNTNPNAISIFFAVGNAIVQKTVNKSGELLSTTNISSFVRDSIFVVNNQVIKKLANGTIAYTKNVDPSVLSRFSSLNAAAEMSDGSFVLGGVHKYLGTLTSGAPFFKDSLILVNTDANLTFQDSIVISRNSQIGFNFNVSNDSLLSLFALPDNRVVALFNYGRTEATTTNDIIFIKLKKQGLKLFSEKSREFYSERLAYRPILTNVCGNNLIFSTYLNFYGQKNSGSGSLDYAFNLDSLASFNRKVVGTGSTDYYGSYRAFGYYQNPVLNTSINGLTVSLSGDDNRYGNNTFHELDVLFFDADGVVLAKKTIPYADFNHVIRTGDTTCLFLSSIGGQTIIFNPDCNNIVPILPDLVLKNLSSGDPSVSQGQIINFKFDAKNIGNGNATNAFSIKSYLSRDKILDAQDYANGVIQTANYPAGTTINQIQGAMMVNNYFTVGNYYLIVKVDGDNQITESNEYNNTVFLPITVTENVNCRYDDSLQLVRLYNATNGANWRYKWQLNTPINTWFGVKLNAKGCVTEVVLPNNNLIGTMPNLLLSFLKTLNLQYNTLTGSIPNFNFSELSTLDLSNCRLSGSIPNFNLPQLGYLKLSNNQLTGAIPNFRLPNLRELDVSYNRLSDTIPAFSYDYLEILNVYSNQLTGNIPNFKLRNLQKMYLNYNQLSGCVPISMKLFCGKDIYLSNNNLSIQNFDSFCGNNTNACNTPAPDLTLANITSPPSVIKGRELAFKVDVKNIGTAASPAYFRIKAYLSTDDRIDNLDVNTEFTSLILNAGETNVQLKATIYTYDYMPLRNYYLILKVDADNLIAETNESNNQLIYSNLIALTSPFTSCRYQDSLELVRLYNATEGARWYDRPWNLNDLITQWSGVGLNAEGCVENLFLADRGLRGTLPNLNLPNLKSLYISGSQIGGSIPNFSLPNLENLSFSYTNLGGNLPNFNLPNLKSLSITNCKLSGTIPNFNLPNLVSLNLSSDSLTGTIPNLNLPNLENLTLEFNQLTGTIPNFNFPKLTACSLKGNQLTGSIPNFNFPDLKELYLNYNKLSGVLPNFNLPNLVYLSVENNELTGAVPNFNLPKLRGMQLGFNQFSGTIPNFGLPKVELIYLNNNQLTGAIPNLNLPLLQTLNLSKNQLSGTLPNFNLLNLLNLYLNNNQLSGCIPLSFRRFCGQTVNISNNPNLATQDFAAFCSANNTGQCGTAVASDIALSISGDPSVYRPFTTHNFTISAINTGNAAFSDVKIKFPFPTKTVSGGTPIASLGSFQEWCSTGQCFEWTIPNMPANTTATLAIPLYVLDAVGVMTATTNLVASTPVDNNAVNNMASVLINRAGAPPPFSIPSKPNQSTPILMQRVNPTIAEHFIVIELESSVNQAIDCQIVNALGTVVLSNKLNVEQGNNKLNFNVEQLPKGMYFIQTSLGNGGNVPMKFVKM